MSVIMSCTMDSSETIFSWGTARSCLITYCTKLFRYIDVYILCMLISNHQGVEISVFLSFSRWQSMIAKLNTKLNILKIILKFGLLSILKLFFSSYMYPFKIFVLKVARKGKTSVVYFLYSCALNIIHVYMYVYPLHTGYYFLSKLDFASDALDLDFQPTIATLARDNLKHTLFAEYIKDSSCKLSCKL